jgi:3-phosphoglycerate kinase
LLGKPIALVPDCIGVAVDKTVSLMKEGDVVLLENVRFYPEEEANDPGIFNVNCLSTIHC